MIFFFAFTRFTRKDLGPKLTRVAEGDATAEPERVGLPRWPLENISPPGRGAQAELGVQMGSCAARQCGLTVRPSVVACPLAGEPDMKVRST